MTEAAPRTVAAIALVGLQGLFAGPAGAQAPAHGFQVKDEVVVHAPPARVYRVLVEQVGEWWDPQHTYTGDSNNLSIDARPGGCFCETLPNGGGVEHLRVVNVAPGELLRMSGALGPLQASGVTGSLSWTLTGADSSTTVGVSYVVGGFMEGGFDRLAPAVHGVIGNQMRRLKSFTETGRPTAAPGRK